MSKEILKRGRAYRCLLSEKQTGEKRYVISHIYKYHIPLDSIPFYCSLCHFQTDDEGKLKEHLKFYLKHKEARESLVRQGKQPEAEEFYLNKNKEGIVATEDVHFGKLSKEESRKIWMERLHKATTSQPQSHPSTPSSLITCSLHEETEMGNTSLGLETLTAAGYPRQPSSSRSGFPSLGATAVDPPHANTSVPVFPDYLDLQDPDGFFSFLNEDQASTLSTPACTPQEEVEEAVVTPDPPRPQTQSGKQAAPDKKTEEQSKTPLAAPKEALPIKNVDRVLGKTWRKRMEVGQDPPPD